MLLALCLAAGRGCTPAAVADAWLPKGLVAGLLVVRTGNLFDT